MKIRNASDTERIELQMTPMIDIVFQLLVFFIRVGVKSLCFGLVIGHVDIPHVGGPVLCVGLSKDRLDLSLVLSSLGGIVRSHLEEVPHFDLFELQAGLPLVKELDVLILLEVGWC